MTNLHNQLQSYSGRRVLITGVHGFKGAWLAELLIQLGAEVHGYGLATSESTDAAAHPNSDGADSSSLLFRELDLENRLASLAIGDVADYSLIQAAVNATDPDIVIHMAAQPLVSLGYEDPMLTYHSNVMGTVALLEAVRNRANKRKISVISVTTDKVYENLEKDSGYVETDALKGFDPYSNSKSCADLATHSFNVSYFKPTHSSDAPVILSTVRAGNVIGGGDFSDNRIVPDLVRAEIAKEPILVRAPDSIRPYQHVLDAVAAYALLAIRSYDDLTLAGEYNIGPNEGTILTTSGIIEAFGRVEIQLADETFHETSRLFLDSTKFRDTFGWVPQWGEVDELLGETFAWYDNFNAYSFDRISVQEFTAAQIGRFLNA